MKHNTTIRSELEKFISRENINIRRFSKIVGINPGTLSAIINGNPPKPIAVSQLDLITAGMGLPEGALYELFVDECFVIKAPHWRRLSSFLQRCAQLEKYECIEQVVQRLADDLSFIPGIFRTAEILYRQGWTKAAGILYKCVAEGEKYQHSERLAICQYRLFSLSISHDQQANLRAAVLFECFVDRLTEEEQLDALLELVNVYFTLRYPEKVIEFADMLDVKARFQYVADKRKVDESGRKTKHPIFVYIAYGYLMKAAVYGRNKDYEQAWKYTQRYADMDWPKDLDEEGQKYVAKFQNWGVANTYAYKLLLGKLEVLPQYVSYISANEGEILPGLMVVMEVANRFDIDVDEVLTLFEVQLSSYNESVRLDVIYTEQTSQERYVKFMVELGMYYLRRKRHEMGLKCILHSLETSIKINNEESIIKCVKIFEKFRHIASVEEQEEYKKLVEELAVLR